MSANSTPIQVLPDTQGEQPRGGRSLTKMQKRVLAGGSVGQFVEFYDFALYALNAVVISQLFFPSASTSASLLATFAAFGVAFVVRPLGGLFFGALGDKIGRRRVLTITLLSTGGATALIGILPTYNQINFLAPLLLVLCRMVQGFSAGGESVGAPSFVFEHAPINRRGLWINITLAVTALPSVVGGFLFLVLSHSMSNELYLAWGWRIPFLMAVPLAAVGLWIRFRTEESEIFIATKKEQVKEFSPIREAFSENKLRMIQVILVMGLTAMGFYFLTGYFISYGQTSGGLTREQSLLINGGAMLLYAVLLPVGGLLSDKFGRKPMLIAGSFLLAVAALPCFMLVTSGTLVLALLGQLLLVIPLSIYGGGCFTFFVEIFTTKTRFTSAAISYNAGYAIFGGTAPFIGAALVGVSGVSYAPGFYMMAAAIVVLLLLLFTPVPETRGRIG